MFCLYKVGRYEETSTVEDMCTVYIKEEDVKMESTETKGKYLNLKIRIEKICLTNKNPVMFFSQYFEIDVSIFR